MRHAWIFIGFLEVLHCFRKIVAIFAISNHLFSFSYVLMKPHLAILWNSIRNCFFFFFLFFTTQNLSLFNGASTFRLKLFLSTVALRLTFWWGHLLLLFVGSNALYSQLLQWKKSQIGKKLELEKIKLEKLGKLQIGKNRAVKYNFFLMVFKNHYKSRLWKVNFLDFKPVFSRFCFSLGCPWLNLATKISRRSHS